jgi:uncharacterized DUF497 family protein
MPYAATCLLIYAIYKNHVEKMFKFCILCYMRFEWDAKKSSANELKHGIDFETAKNIWLDENRIEIHAPHPVEDRRITIGKHQNKAWTAIYTMRGNAIRIISVGHARKKEAELYDKEKASEK